MSKASGACKHTCSAFMCCQCKKPSHLGAKASGARTVKAWAVVCEEGKQCLFPLAFPFFPRRQPAEEAAAGLPGNCGPHTVIELRGTFTPKAKARRSR